MKILLLLVWSSLALALVHSQLISYNIDVNHKDYLSDGFCTIRDLTNDAASFVITDEAIVPSLRCKRDTGRFDRRGPSNRQRPGARPGRPEGGARQSFGNRERGGGFFKRRDNDHGALEGRFRERYGNNHRPYNHQGGDRRDRFDDRRPYGDRGDDRRPFRDRDNDRGNRRPYQDRGGERRPYQDRGGDRRPYQDRGGDRRPYQDRGGDRRPYQARGGDRRPYQDRGGGDRRPYQDRGGGDRRPYQDRGGDRRPYQDRGGDRRSFGNRDGDRRPFRNDGDSNRRPNRDDRRPYRDQDNNRRPYNNRDGGGRGGYDDRNHDRDRDRSHQDDNRRGRPRQSENEDDDRSSVRQGDQPRRRGKSSELISNVTKYRLLKVTSKRIKQEFDLKATGMANIDDSFFEYSDRKKHPSKKSSSEYETDQSVKGVSFSESQSSEEDGKVQPSTAKATRKQKLVSPKTTTEEYASRSEGSYEEYSTEIDSSQEAESKGGNLQMMDSKLKEYSTEDDYTEDETPFKQDSEYSDDDKTTKSKLKKAQTTTTSHKSSTPSQTHTTLQKESTTKPSTRNLAHRTPKLATKKDLATVPAINDQDSTEEKSSDYENSYKEDYTEEKSGQYEKLASKFTPHSKDSPVKRFVGNQDSSTYENSGDYKDSDEYDLSEGNKETSTQPLTSRDGNDRKISSKLSSTATAVHKTTSPKDSYDDSYSDEKSKNSKKCPPELTPTLNKDRPTKEVSKSSPKPKSTKHHETSYEDTEEYETSYEHDYTEEKSEKSPNKAHKHSPSAKENPQGDLSFYDDSHYTDEEQQHLVELSEESKKKLSSSMDFFKNKIYVYNTKTREFKFVNESAYRKMNIGDDIAFGYTGTKQKTRREEKFNSETLKPIFYKQLNVSSVKWPTFTQKAASGNRYTSRLHPSRRTFYGRPTRKRHVHPPKGNGKQ